MSPGQKKFKSHQEFFDRAKYIVVFHQTGETSKVTVEELYQHFKSRVDEEFAGDIGVLQQLLKK